MCVSGNCGYMRLVRVCIRGGVPRWPFVFLNVNMCAGYMTKLVSLRLEPEWTMDEKLISSYHVDMLTRLKSMKSRTIQKVYSEKKERRRKPERAASHVCDRSFSLRCV